MMITHITKVNFVAASTVGDRIFVYSHVNRVFGVRGAGVVALTVALTVALIHTHIALSIPVNA